MGKKFSHHLHQQAPRSCGCTPPAAVPHFHVPWQSHGHNGNPFVLPWPAAPAPGTHSSQNGSCSSLGSPSPPGSVHRALQTSPLNTVQQGGKQDRAGSHRAAPAQHRGSLQLPGLLGAVQFGPHGTGGPNDLNAMLLQEENPCTHF